MEVDVDGEQPVRGERLQLLLRRDRRRRQQVGGEGACVKSSGHGLARGAAAVEFPGGAPVIPVSPAVVGDVCGQRKGEQDQGRRDPPSRLRPEAPDPFPDHDPRQGEERHEEARRDFTGGRQQETDLEGDGDQQSRGEGVDPGGTEADRQDTEDGEGHPGRKGHDEELAQDLVRPERIHRVDRLDAGAGDHLRQHGGIGEEAQGAGGQQGGGDAGADLRATSLGAGEGNPEEGDHHGRGEEVQGQGGDGEDDGQHPGTDVPGEEGRLENQDSKKTGRKERIGAAFMKVLQQERGKGEEQGRKPGWGPSLSATAEEEEKERGPEGAPQPDGETDGDLARSEQLRERPHQEGVEDLVVSLIARQDDAGAVPDVLFDDPPFVVLVALEESRESRQCRRKEEQGRRDPIDPLESEGRDRRAAGAAQQPRQERSDAAGQRQGQAENLQAADEVVAEIGDRSEAKGQGIHEAGAGESDGHQEERGREAQPGPAPASPETRRRRIDGHAAQHPS